MSHQKFMPGRIQTETVEEKPFEFKPLDLSSFLGAKTKRRVRIPCVICGIPGCQYEITIDE